MYDNGKTRLRALRRRFSAVGWALLIYYVIMNAAVAAVMIFDLMQGILLGQTQDHSTWGYFLAIAVGCVLLLLWKKSDFCFKTLWRRGRPMKPGSLLALLTLCLGAQFISQIVMILLELIFNSLGKSMMDYLLSIQSDDTLAMFLYVGIGAPISEELLFRGLVLRTMEPYGKKFAIFASALLFGLFHGNLIQIPFAFAVGLVLGYVAVEYNIVWAMALHMFNNLIYADTAPRLLEAFLPKWENALSWAVILLTAAGSLVILLVKRRAVSAYLRRERTDPLCPKAFFSAAGIIVFMAVLLLTTAVALFLMAA